MAEAERLRNWAGNLQYGAGELHLAASTDEVRTLVKRLPRVKALGTRHCFNAIADGDEHFISLSEMNRVTALDLKSHAVTVEGGMTYGQLAPWLHEKGLALHNLASLPHISIAGSCATATHGSGVKNKNLATQVSALEIVTADGELLKLSRGSDPAFQGVVVNLGALGVVTRVTLDVEPAFTMKQEVYLDLPMSQLAGHFDAVMSGGYSVSLFTDWRRNCINQVWLKRRVDDAASLKSEAEFHGARLARTNVHPVGEFPSENCTEQMGAPGPWHGRLPHFRMGFTPSAGKELQTEYFVPLKNAVEAILAVERLRDHVIPLLMISELRAIDADDLWMSPCYMRPSLGIHFTWKQDWESVRRVLPLLEKELAPFDVRPHWGKLFTLPPAQLQSRYEKLSDFKRLIHLCDPHGKFRNEFLSTNLYC